VDDAIVVVENIHRRRALASHQSLSEIIRKRWMKWVVDNSGDLHVIAALLPMAFVSGLMGRT